MIRLASVSKSFGDSQVLKSIDLHVKHGETKILLGTSGCGKSTILRLMVGLLQPTSGQVYFDGQPIETDRLPEIRKRMGYVIQDGGLFPHLTAFQNSSLMAQYLRWETDRVRERVAELAELTHLEPDLLNRFPRELSGGQRQRVSLIRALMLDPDVMLMDEPLGALDPITRADLQSDLKDVFRQLHKTVVIVTHDIGEAAHFGDDIVLIRDGQIIQQGSFEQLLHHPQHEFVSRFINAQRPKLDQSEDEA